MKNKNICSRYRELIFDYILSLNPDQKCNIIIDFSKNNSFDPSLAESILEFYYEHEEISESQEDALNNIIEKFRMVSFKEKEGKVIWSVK